MKINNWGKWQSYRKDRGAPPWIKIYRNLMTNPEWAILTDAEKGQLVSLWIVAADKNGEIPNNPRLLKKICLIDEEPNISKFIELGFIESDGCHCDATVTPSRQPHDAPDQIRGETDKMSNSSELNTFAEFWELYPRKDKKKDAEKVWKRLSKAKQAKALKDIRTRFEGTDRKFIPLPPSYLNAERWDDESTEKSNSLFDEDGAI